MKKIGLFRGQALYDVLPIEIDELATAFRDLGHDVQVVDLFAPDVNEQFKRVLSPPADFIFAFNGMGSGIRVGNQSAFDACRVLYMTLLVDHPMYIHDRVFPDVRHFQVFCIDRTHPVFLDRLFGGRVRARFFPHGGSQAAVPGRPFAERDVDVLFAGSYYDFEAQRSGWKRLPGDAVKLMETLAAVLLTAPERAQFDGIMEFWQSQGRVPDDALFREMVKLLPSVDKFVSGYRRLSALKQLADAGIRVCVCGDGWDRSPLRGAPTFTFEAPRIYPDLLALMTRSKVVLNLLPNFPDGSHERVFSAMLNGAVSVSTHSRFLAETFMEGEDVLFYRWDRLAELPAIVSQVLAQPERWKALAAAGQAKARAGHTWRHRAEQLITLADAVRKD